jgi:hypothetical protein
LASYNASFDVGAQFTGARPKAQTIVLLAEIACGNFGERT